MYGYGRYHSFESNHRCLYHALYVAWPCMLDPCYAGQCTEDLNAMTYTCTCPNGVDGAFCEVGKNTKNAHIDGLVQGRRNSSALAMELRLSCTSRSIWWLVCQKQESSAGTSNYIPQYLWGVVTCPCLCYVLLAHQSWHIMIVDPCICKRKARYNFNVINALWKHI